MSTQASIDLAQQMFVVYYGRPADPGGLAYWASVFDTTNDLSQALNAFGNSDEFTSLFGALSVNGLINNLYQQMYGRDPDADGLAFYANLLETGAATLASIGKQIADGSQNSDLDTLKNKITAANSFTDQIDDLNALYDASSIPAAQALLAIVDNFENSVTEVINAIIFYTSNLPISDTPNLISLPSTGTFSLQPILGTSAVDSLSYTSDSSETPVLIALDGNDSLFIDNNSGVLLGGNGDDSYGIGNTGIYLVFDSTGNDSLAMPSRYDDIGLYTINSGQDLILYDESGLNNIGLVLPDWQDANHRIETFVLLDGTYSYNDLAQAVALYSDGDFSDEYAAATEGLPGSIVDPHIELFEYLGSLDSTNIDEVMDIDISGAVGSEALMSYLLLS